MKVAAHFRVMSRIHVSTDLRNGDPADCFKSDCDLLTKAYVLYYVITSGWGSASEPTDNHFIYAFLRSSRCLSIVSNYRMISEMMNWPNLNGVVRKQSYPALNYAGVWMEALRTSAKWQPISESGLGPRTSRIGWDTQTIACISENR